MHRHAACTRDLPSSPSLIGCSRFRCPPCCAAYAQYESDEEEDDESEEDGEEEEEDGEEDGEEEDEEHGGKSASLQAASKRD